VAVELNSRTYTGALSKLIRGCASCVSWLFPANGTSLEKGSNAGPDLPSRRRYIFVFLRYIFGFWMGESDNGNVGHGASFLRSGSEKRSCCLWMLDERWINF
jgi:hypothetical protein